MAKRTPSIEFDNAEELIEALGGIGLRRLKLKPPPGTATEADLLQQNERKSVLCELVEGTLVEKPIGYSEDDIGSELIMLLRTFVRAHGLGIVGGAQACMRLMPGTVRVPDVHYISWDRLPGRRRPTAPVPEIAPNLVAEILSESNTRGEMERKRREYFFAGTLLVWEVDPRRREIDVYTTPLDFVTLTVNDVLTGGDVLPGFCVPVAQLFADAPGEAPLPPAE